MLSLAWMEAFCGRVRSISNSVRSEAGKNCCGTWRMPTSARAKIPAVTAMVIQRKRMAVTSRAV